MRVLSFICAALAACASSAHTDAPPASSPTLVSRAAVVPEARVPTVVPRLETAGMSCDATGILECRDGQIDACHKVPDPGPVHACVDP